MTERDKTILRYWKPWRLAPFAAVGFGALGFSNRRHWELPVLAGRS